MYDLEKAIEPEFNGVLSVTKYKKSLYKKAFGYADLPNKVRNTLNTRFATASAGKFFVAIGILQLVEQGLLRLTDPIGAILDFDLRGIDPAITVQQLLTHTSGIPDYFDESVMHEYAALWVDFPNYKIRKSRDLLPLFIHKPMMYKAGEKFQYNNSGFVILGIILEIKTGLMFDHYLQTQVFDRAKMRQTGYYELDRLPAKCASAYIVDPATGDYYTNIYSVDAKGTGAGGAFTTVGDIEHLWQALLAGKLLSNDSLQQMFSIQATDAENKYGFGVWLSDYQGRIIPFFQGYDPGVSFISSYDFATESSITILSNLGNNVWRMESSLNHEVRGIV